MWKLNMIYHILRIKGGESVMAVIYATLIVMEVKTFAQVPKTLKKQVRQILIDLEMEHLAVE